MIEDTRIGIIFQQTQVGIIASLALNDLDETIEDVDTLLSEATKIYSSATTHMKEILDENKKLRAENKKIPARLMWDLGDTIFKMVDDLGNKNLILENIYDSLTRDISTSSGTIKRVLSIRRCIKDRGSIPKNLNWGSLKGAPRKYLKKSFNEKQNKHRK